MGMFMFILLYAHIHTKYSAFTILLNAKPKINGCQSYENNMQMQVNIIDVLSLTCSQIHIAKHIGIIF